jgi:hypothetical protein
MNRHDIWQHDCIMCLRARKRVQRLNAAKKAKPGMLRSNMTLPKKFYEGKELNVIRYRET